MHLWYPLHRSYYNDQVQNGPIRFRGKCIAVGMVAGPHTVQIGQADNKITGNLAELKSPGRILQKGMGCNQS